MSSAAVGVFFDIDPAVEQARTEEKFRQQRYDGSENHDHQERLDVPSALPVDVLANHVTRTSQQFLDGEKDALVHVQNTVLNLMR